MKPIPGYPKYSITEEGEVFRTIGGARYGRSLPYKLTPSNARNNGYQVVSLCRNGVQKMMYVHDLVLRTFIGPRPQGMYAAHNDGNRWNPRLSNLRWDTQANNLADKIKHGTDQRGEKSTSHKLTDAQVAEIRAYPRTWHASRDLAVTYGVSANYIYMIRKGLKRTFVVPSPPSP